MKMTFPNLVTTLRIILAPIFVIYLINDQAFYSLIVFIIASISDGLDGLVARLFDQKSRLGSYLDPIADKIVLVSAFIGLAIKEMLPSWLSVMVISRDVMILLGILILFFNGMKFRIRPSIVSKITTCFQFVTVIVAYVKGYFYLLEASFSFFIYLTAILTVSSGLHYVYVGFKMIGNGSDGSQHNGGGN